MKSLPWRREETIARLRREIWLYVTQAAKTEEDILLVASALLQMPASEVRFLAQLQFILSEPVGRLLEELPLLIRRLTTTTTNETELTADRIRGAIRWSETFAQRAATGTSHLFVTAPTRRAFDTPENEVLAFALRAIAQFGRRSGWNRSTTAGPAQVLRTRVATATRWSQARALVDIPPRVPTPKTLSRVRSGRSRRRYQAALDVCDLYQRYIARLDRAAIREAIEAHGLVTNRDSVLLELQCAFQTIKTLRQLGWQAPPAGLLRPPLIFRGERQGASVRLYFQRAPAELAAGSRYRAVQQAHEFSAASGLIPDLVIRMDGAKGLRWLLVEVKGGEKRSVEDSARAATLDLLAYRRAYGAALHEQDGVYGLGYAWGAQLQPAPASEIVLCTPDTLEVALRRAVADSEGLSLQELEVY